MPNEKEKIREKTTRHQQGQSGRKLNSERGETKERLKKNNKVIQGRKTIKKEENKKIRERENLSMQSR